MKDCDCSDCSKSLSLVSSDLLGPVSWIVKAVGLLARIFFRMSVRAIDRLYTFAFLLNGIRKC